MYIFDLHKGQTDHEIYEEIERKTSPESEQQMLDFYYPNTVTEIEKWNVQKPVHEVTSSSETYAIIRKNWSMMGTKRYYLAGINDEGYYFVHELPSELGERSIPVNQLVQIINKENDGFARIQGDVLLKTVPITDFAVHEISPLEYRKIKKTVDIKGFFGKTKSHETITDDLEIVPESLYPETLKGNNEYSTKLYFTQTYGYNHKEHNKPARDMVVFSNHKIKVNNGRIYSTTIKDIFIILGNQLDIEHVEHETKNIKIPLGHCIILTIQPVPSYINKGE